MQEATTSGAEANQISINVAVIHGIIPVRCHKGILARVESSKSCNQIEMASGCGGCQDTYQLFGRGTSF